MPDRGDGLNKAQEEGEGERGWCREGRSRDECEPGVELEGAGRW